MTRSRPWPNPPVDATTIHHVSDTHLGYSTAYNGGGGWDRKKLISVARDVNGGLVRHVHGMVHTGNITNAGGHAEHSEHDEQARLWLDRLYYDQPDVPVVAMPGDHDLRERDSNLGSALAFSADAWEHAYDRDANGVTDIGDVRVVHLSPSAVNITEPGEWRISSGRLDWAAAQAAESDRPVLLASHYPLAQLEQQHGDTGETGDRLAPVDDITELIDGHDTIIGVLCGHRQFPVDDDRIATVLDVGSRRVVHVCAPSVAFSLAAGRQQSNQAFAPQYSAFVSIVDEDTWQVRIRSHTPPRWADQDGYRLIELDRDGGTVTRSNGTLSRPGAGRWDVSRWGDTTWDW